MSKQNTVIKTFGLRISFICHHCQISPQIFEKFETALIGYSGDWGKLILEKKLEVENLGH
jgi:hypothetical protein